MLNVDRCYQLGRDSVAIRASFVALRVIRRKTDDRRRKNCCSLFVVRCPFFNPVLRFYNSTLFFGQAITQRTTEETQRNTKEIRLVLVLFHGEPRRRQGGIYSSVIRLQSSVDKLPHLQAPTILLSLHPAVALVRANGLGVI